MIKVSVMYPNKPGARFNHEYYRDDYWLPMGANSRDDDIVQCPSTVRVEMQKIESCQC